MKITDKILSRIKKIILNVEPKANIYLYGSRARKDNKKHSDYDILILLEQNKINLTLERKISYPLFDLEFEIGEIISPMIYSKKEWETKYTITPFYENVMKERIKL